MRCQHPVAGGREPLPSCVIKEIRREVERAAYRFDVSRSFVVATALAETFGISIERYDQVVSKSKFKRRKHGKD